MKTPTERALEGPAYTLAVAAALGLAACGQATDAPHNLGNTATGEVGHTAPPATAAGFMGVWVGEAEIPLAVTDGGGPAIYRFPSGSARIRIEIAAGAVIAEQDRGSITFGDAPPLPPPMNPDIGYPPGLDETLWDEPYGNAPLLMPFEGFAYTLLVSGEANTGEGWMLPDSLEDGVIRLGYLPNEIFTDWCALQVPQPMGDGAFNCLGGSTITSSFFQDPGAGIGCEITPFVSMDVPAAQRREAGQQRSIDCGRAFLCEMSTGPICRCALDACRVDVSSNPSGLYLRQEGDALVGNFVQAVFLRDDQLYPLGKVTFHRE